MSKVDSYTALGLSPGATIGEIRAAYVAILDKLRKGGLAPDVATARLDAARSAFKALTAGPPVSSDAKQKPPLVNVSPHPQAKPLEGSANFNFTGQAGEYFHIWIVNVCLSVATFGIYSAWAKVRRKRYFYGNTLLNDTSFEYLADPKAILKGRLLVVATLAVLSMIRNILHIRIFGLVYILLLPYVVIKAGRFNATNSSYRNVRFRFGIDFQPGTGIMTRHFIDGYNETLRCLVRPLFLASLSLGLLYPYYVYRKRKFILGHSSYGTTLFTFDAQLASYYLAYFKSALLFIACMLAGILTLGIGILPFYILFASYRDAAIGKLNWRHTMLGDLRFNCTWKVWDLFKLNLLNSLGILCSMGLLVPWAEIRWAQYQLQGITLEPADKIDNFVATEVQHVEATGDEASDLLGFDFGL